MWNLAVVQMNCFVGETEPNLDRIEELTTEAASQGANLTVFPECITTGYFVADQIERLAEPIPGPSSERLKALARTTGLHLVVGMIEAAEGRYYDDAVLFVPDGDVHVYRKTHLFGPERQVYTPAEKSVVVDTSVGRLALTVCYDLIFPEYIRSLVLDGARVILNCTDWITNPWQTSMGWEASTVSSLVRTRALENGVYVAMADRVGEEDGWTSLGGSTIASPTGRPLVELGDEEGIGMGQIDLESPDLAKWAEVATYLQDRRPELYERRRASV
jgi:predicted amidohydrolase